MPYADEVRKQAGIGTIAIGLILDPQQAEDILVAGQADVIGREALFDSNWPLHAQMALGGSDSEVFGDWPKERREPGLHKLEGPATVLEGMTRDENGGGYTTIFCDDAPIAVRMNLGVSRVVGRTH